MIFQAAIIEWSAHAPWSDPAQVEHDLVLSRAICELYAHPVVREHLLFRGGTVLHKLCFTKPGRFSEDLDFVQIKAGPIGLIVDAVRECLDSWLGKPRWKQTQGRFTLTYKFHTEIMPVSQRKVKIEINTREHFCVQGIIAKNYSVQSSWFSGECSVQMYCLEELMATKLRALYQRKKGRDLYDFWYVHQQQKKLDPGVVVKIFQQYLVKESVSISRANFEENLQLKRQSESFRNDMRSLLPADEHAGYSVDEASNLLLSEYLSLLFGSAWRCEKLECESV